MSKDTIYRQDAIKAMPPAEKPFKLPEIYVADGYDTVADGDGNVGFGVYIPDENYICVAGDVMDEIRARALLHEVCHWVQAMCGRPFNEDEANEFSDLVYNALTYAQPEEFEWCHDCKEYDQTEHCCHRWTKVIRKTVEEITSAQSEPKNRKEG